MKIIKNIKDIEGLQFGDQYVIEPKGLNYQKPETFFEFHESIEEIQNAIQEMFNDKESHNKKTNKVKPAKK